MPDRQPLPAVLIGAVLGLAAMATLFAVTVIDAPHLMPLERQHADAEGSVVRLIPDSHGQVEIEYHVAGVTY